MTAFIQRPTGHFYARRTVAPEETAKTGCGGVAPEIIREARRYTEKLPNAGKELIGKNNQKAMCDASPAVGN